MDGKEFIQRIVELTLKVDEGMKILFKKGSQTGRNRH